MAIAKAVVDQAQIPTLTQLEDASRVVKEKIEASSGDSRREISMEVKKLSSELATKQKAFQEITATEARDRLAKDALSDEIDAKKAQATKLESEIENDDGQLLLVDADLRDLKRSYDSAVIARMELEAEYPVLAEPVPELPQSIQDWISEFQGMKHQKHVTAFGTKNHLESTQWPIVRLESEASTPPQAMFCGGFQLETHNLDISVGCVLQGALRPPKLGSGNSHTADLHDRRSIRHKGRLAPTACFPNVDHCRCGRRHLS